MPRSGSTLLESKFLDAGYDSVGESLLIENLIRISLATRGNLDGTFVKNAYVNNIAARGITRTTWVDKSLSNYKLGVTARN